MTNNQVSIIIPVFNLEAFLEKCIDSIIGQTYNNIEIIIIDDGSTDSSRTIIENYRQKDSRIHLLKGDHKGTAAARKLGIQFAHGDYLTFVDGDDWLDKDSIETMVMPFTTSECDIVVAQHRRVFIEEETRYEFKDDYPFDIIDPISFMDIINERKDFTLWAKMFKKELFENIIFHVGVPIGQDGLVLKQAILKSTIIYATNKIVYNYLYRKGSAMRKSTLIINKLHFLKGSFNNLPIYTGDLYVKERDRLITFLSDLGTYYLKMDKGEKDLYMQIWEQYILAKNLQVEFKKSNPKGKNLNFIKKYPTLNSVMQLTPIYLSLAFKKFKK